jgi:membrane dipeptidase
MTDRRSFLKMAAATAASALIANKADSQAKARPERMMVVNGLGALYNPNTFRMDQPTKTGTLVLDKRTIDDALSSGLAAVCITLGNPGADAGKEGEFEGTVEDIARWTAAITADDRLVKVNEVSDILRAWQERKIGVVFGFQNMAMVGDRPQRVDIFADLGVRCFQLTYNSVNQLGGGSLAAGDPPLTAFGRQVIDRINAKNGMVDLSHSGRRTCLEAARYSSRPISINHTGCRALSDSPRNKTDEELKLVAAKGGYVGIYLMNFLSVGRRFTGDDVAAHIDHAIKVCGEDHVGIGTDGGTTGIDDVDAFMEDYAKFVEKRRALGIAAPGEDPKIPRFAADLNGPQQFAVIAEKMAKKGYQSAVIEKVMSGNYLRFAREIWQHKGEVPLSVGESR